MKKVLFAVVMGVLSMSILLCGCNSGPSNTNESTTPTSAEADTSWNEIEQKGKLVVGLDIAFPPMGFQDENNEIVGLDIDLAKAVAEELGVEAELKPIDWKAKEMELKSGKIDVIWNGYSISEERKKEVLFSEPYLMNRQVVVIKQDSPIKSKQDMVNGKVGLQTGSTAEDAIKADPIYDQIKDNLMMYDDNNTAMMDLETGRISSVVVDEVVYKYYTSKHPGQYTTLDEDFGDEQYGIGFRMEDQALRDKVQEALEKVKESGKAAEISQKWFGEPDLIL